MIKVLMIAKAMEKTGVTSVMFSYFDLIDKSKIQMDIATGSIYEESYKNRVEKAGSHFWVIPNRDKNLIAYIKKLAEIIRGNGYQVVHVHGNSAMAFPELMAAKIGGAKVRIAHSHNTMCNHPKLEKLVRPLFEHYYTHALACSKEAGKWMFKNKPFTVINNGTDTKQMAFLEENRKSVRVELGVSDDELVIGHIGFFNYQKNHVRLIEIYQSILKKNEKTKLLLIGDGGNRPQIEKMVQDCGISNNVIFYGQSNNISRLLCGMDVFVLPSHFEGFGIVLLEAQASGLNCITSSVVPENANAADAVEFLSLEKSNDEWADTILKAAYRNLKCREEKSEMCCKKMMDRKFDVQIIANEMCEFYIKAVRESEA